ncbi:MAG: SprT-like family protein [Isosphaerales bacterium]
MNDADPFLDAPGPNLERQAKLFVLLYSAGEVESRVRRIYEAILDQSPQIREGNFRLIGTDDLERLFGWYDREFFRGRLGEMVLEDEAHPIAFRLSRRLVSAAGQTIRQVRRVQRGGKPAVRVDYEITVSATLLFNTFQNVERTVTVGGLVCRDRLEALQRIFEHELLHLAEFLGWGRSNCRADNFHALSRRIFAHEGAFHDLITPREQAKAAFNIHVGDHVTFELDGIERIGRVNRITRRATVLVEDPRGTPYSDGKRYVRFYVPLPRLRKVTAPLVE